MSNGVSQVTDKNNPTVRKSVNLLPVLFRTDKNAKFLSGTLDQLIQPPQLKRVDGWVGSKITPTFDAVADQYLTSNTKLRQDYQLEPALVITDEVLKVIKSTSYDDLINQLEFEGAKVNRLDRLFKPEFYSYDPHIDWDKFVNFEKYYWLPNGPDSIAISNQQREVVSTYNVTDTADGFYFVFTPDGLTPAPQITLYRGVTYRFNIKSKNPFWIKTARVAGAEAPFRVTENNGIAEGQITLKVDHTTPKTLYFVSENDKLNGGKFIVKSIDENTAINVEKEIIGKKNYTSYNGVEFTNGLKVHFLGDVTPAEYKDKQFIIEGVGSAIKLIDFNTLATPEKFISVFDEKFDSDGFDEYAYDQSNNLALVPEYITINKSSQDKNPWTRYNRWFHEDVIRMSAEFNNVPVLMPVTSRAKRPIIEFVADLQLNNFGSFAKPNVQFIDTTTTDVFTDVEGSLGYYVDGEALGQGDRVIFTADTDNFVNGKTYYVNFVKIEGKFRISLEEADDVTPVLGDSITVTKGTEHKGTNWWYNGTEWVSSQQKTKINQAPLFAIFDKNEIDYSDTETYKGGFLGSRVFGYADGTGANDPVLGFPLKYKNVANQAYYLFQNYFATDKNIVVDGNITYTVDVKIGFLKKNVSRNSSQYLNTWTEAVDYALPILQYEIASSGMTELEVTAIENPGYQQMTIDVFVNDVKQTLITDYTLFASGRRYFVEFKSALSEGDRVLLKIITDAEPSATGFYETAPNWTNNPLNNLLTDFTLSELSDHVKTMVDRSSEFTGQFPGAGNIRDINNLTQYGTRLIANKNPLAFAGYFIANDEFNLVSSVRFVAQHYNQFKLNLIDQISKLGGKYSPIQALDIALYNVNINKDISFPYSTSDMVPYGTDAITRTYDVTDSRNKVYSVSSVFNLTELSNKAVIVYHIDVEGNTTQLLHGKEYEFDLYDSSVIIKISLARGDQIRVDEYANTDGCYVPPTPTKLGLYPKFEPKIYLDDTYVEPQMVIQGHDGSIMLAFGDDRDQTILEYEKRVYNNLKTQYNSELFDIDSIMPGAFRSTGFTKKETDNIISREFLKWDSFYGFNFKKNNTVTEDPKTWNYASGKDLVTGLPLPGGWRGIYKFFFDTDRPHTHPWEMLGLREEPEWWTDTYGPAPYTRGNKLLWSDIETGTIRYPSGVVISSNYIRSGLSKILPIDDGGNLLMPAQANIATGVDYNQTDKDWEFGDYSPVETAWRRSSYWPFVVQILSALVNPSSYAARLFDTSRMVKNLAGQYVYSNTSCLVKPADLVLCKDTIDDQTVRSAGYSVFLIETGLQKNNNYLDKLSSELKFVTSKLTHKLGGFVNKDKFKILIDSVNPTSTNPGVTVPQEDYTIFLDKSSPIKSIGVSGIIVEKTSNGYSVRGYDKINPYFKCLMPVFTAADSAMTIGGKSEAFIEWEASTGFEISGVDTTSVSTSDGYNFYKQGQVVRHQGRYYRVKISHSASNQFDISYYQPLPALPTVGGVSVRVPKNFSTDETLVPYGMEYASILEVYELLLGYGKWLETQGLIFDEYNKALEEVVNWMFSAKELLFWSTQKWAVGSVITLSPFAETLRFKDETAVVDSLTNIFYEYSVLKADGSVLSDKNISTYREENEFVLQTTNTVDGIYFVRLNLVQKEHTLILDNNTMFSDVIYDLSTGYRQRRIKLIGFITDNWNGDIFSPGFVYDDAQIQSWKQYTDYSIGDVVFYAGNYYSATAKIPGTETFNFNQWNILGSKPVAELLPNFDYKIGQFDDFYSLDIDNFDQSQQALAQHLIGYSPRTYLDNIFINSISQYKFYQGFIKEKGTKNTLDKLGKASIVSQGSYIDFYEDWAFRIGEYGAFQTDNSIEFNLDETKFKENPQIVNFVDVEPAVLDDFIVYKTPASLDIKPKDYNSRPFFTDTDLLKDNVSALPVAGYARIDDITATAFNKNSLLDIANNRDIKDGDTVWVGFEDNGDWNIYRYTQIQSKVADTEIYIPGSSLLITTDSFHGLNVGDLLSISQFDAQIDGVYTVDAVPELNQIIVSSSLTNLNVPFYPAIGLMFKFVKSRFDKFDSLAELDTINRFVDGEKIWIDDSDGLWTVYQKTDNFTVFSRTSNDRQVVNQQFGYNIAGSKDGTKFVVAAPYYDPSSAFGLGRVYTYKKVGSGSGNFVYTGGRNVNPSSISTFFTGTTTALFGASMYLDSSDTLFISAPKASNVKYNSTSSSFTVVEPNYTATAALEVGLIEIFKIDFEDLTSAPPDRLVLTNPLPEANANFGHSMFVGTDSLGKKILFASAPWQTSDVSSNAGAVYYTTIDVSGDVPEVSGSYGRVAASVTTGSNFGYSISGSDDATVIAVAAPGNNGSVYVYVTDSRDYSTPTQVISYDDLELKNIIRSGDRFADSVLVDPTGNYLFVSSPESSAASGRQGKVVVYKLNPLTDRFELLQTLINPFIDNGYNFGNNLTINSAGNTLIVSTLGGSHKPFSTFDTYNNPVSNQQPYILNPSSGKRAVTTTFDSETTKFYSTIKNSGAAFTFVRKGEKFVYANELFDTSIRENYAYGKNIFVYDRGIVVGAPGHNYTLDYSGSIYVYETTTDSLSSWNVLRQQPALVDVSKIKSVKTIDTVEDAVVDYLEVIDPVKGKISGIADSELRYKSLFDPAVYSIGISGVSIDTNSNWLDEHVGELWWDLGSVKYTWYEQGELEFRKNNWNSMFPGSMIDVYEWVRSSYLPSQWSSIADTNEGLAQGISGQPKYADNSVISVKQIWDPVSNSFSNVYYFWVKNKITVPQNVDRKISAYNVATLIADPKAQGVKHISVLSEDALMLVNMQSNIVGDTTNLAIEIDSINNINNKHTEWLLVQEGNPTSKPPAKIINKMLDSIIGVDALDNLVPDPALSSRTRYGIGIRPRQTIFKDKTGAIRTLVEYANSILAKNNIVDITNLDRFSLKDEVPNIKLALYDTVVEDLVERDFSINTRSLKRGELSCTVVNGKINSVEIVNRGYGYYANTLVSEVRNSDSPYYVGPKVSVVGDGSGAEIETEINSLGQIVRANIVNSGMGYTSAPTLTVRAFTVVVSADETINNKWSKYEWDYNKKEYIRVYSQSYDTTIYWKYIDWKDATYNDSQDIIATINEPYQLSALLNVPAGNYVKIRNAGDGRYVILRKISDDQSSGTYNRYYDIVYQEKGTVQLLDTLWNYAESIYGWDQVAGWDQTLWDQTPTREMSNIFLSLLEDIFVGELKVYANLLFFKLVKYALTEQKFLDWAFKTSFVNIVNYAGSLDQRPIYKLNNESYYQSYIEETKPYHTKVRNFTVNYTATDITQSVSTDFDLPSVYDTNSRQFVPITFGRSELLEYPWKSWVDNYTYSVESIEVYSGGSGYDTPPVVEIVPQPGDTGSGATAVAYIALGKVTQIIVTNRGSGYTATPIVNLLGGGPTTLTPARVSIRMVNDRVRSNKITMKFDRVAGYDEVVGKTAYDKFISTGLTNKFPLTWAPNPDKTFITVTINKIRLLSGEYEIETYTEKTGGYTKKYGRLVLDTIPVKRSEIEIEYRKDVSLYNAIDRIREYYEPTSGMPGNTATLLMNGLEYPGVTVDTLPFGLSSGWDSTPFGTNNWDDYVLDSKIYETKGPRSSIKVAAVDINDSNQYYFDILTNNSATNVIVGATATVDSVLLTVTTSTINFNNRSQWTLGVSATATYSINVGDVITFTNPSGLIYTLPFVPLAGDEYNVYVNGIRIDYPNYTGVWNTLTNYSTSSVVLYNNNYYSASGYISSSTVTPITTNTWIKTSLTNVSIPAFAGNGYNNVVILDKIYDATDKIQFINTSTDASNTIVDPDLDTYISGGGYYEMLNGKLALTKSEDYEDINIDGDQFVSATNSYGPEENLPGRVSDSLGMNIFTYPKSGAGLVVNKQYVRDPAITRYSIGCNPPNISSVNVVVDNIPLTHNVDYTIDFATNEIELNVDPYISVRGPYYNPEDALPAKQGDPIETGAGDDTFRGPYPLGFEWNMFGTLYDEVYVGTNGYITFGGGSSKYTPLVLGELEYPAIYIEYCDLWQSLGLNNTPLSTGETPGLYMTTGSVGNFNYWRLRFVGTHYNKRELTPTVPAYQYEVTLYSDGVNQYVETIYENTWREANFNGDTGFITGIATGKQGDTLGTGVGVNYVDIANNTSHVFYSTSNGGNWQYAGRGSFDPFRNPSDILPGALSNDSTTVITVIDESSQDADVIEQDWINFRTHYPNRRFYLLQPRGSLYDETDIKIPAIFNNSYRATGPVEVNRDNGDDGQISDWFEICGLASLKPGSVVGLAVDISGSMNLDTVRASYDYFKEKVEAAGLTLVESFMSASDERWAYVHDREYPLSPIDETLPQYMSITTIGVGGNSMIEKSAMRVAPASGVNNFEFASNVQDIKSSYVTVNGVKRTNYTIIGNNGSTGRAILQFNSNLNEGDLLQVWFFAADHKAFSEVNEQIISASTGTYEFTLTQPPGVIAPLHSQVIVERDGVRMLPPDTVYYIAEGNQTQFSFTQRYDYTRQPDKSDLEIYVNGDRINFSESLRLKQKNNLIEFDQGIIKQGDAVAISILVDHEYVIQGSKLVLTDSNDVSLPSTIKVTTFTNHDDSLIRKERFPGNRSGTYKLTRSVISSNYVWVELNGTPLTRDVDYRLGQDKTTVIINSKIKVKKSDTVVITSVVDQLNENLLGYRIFRDNLGRTHYKRLSGKHTTQLASDLSATDSYITVEDASVLTPPNQEKHRPGIILINGERIEFYKVEGNKLSWLRRGTLGTGVKSVHKEGSLVVDQGAGQTIPVDNYTRVWTTSTTAWTTGTDNLRYSTSTWNLTELTGLSFNTGTSTQYQIEVNLQGRMLRKPGIDYIRTRKDVAYDSNEVNSLGTSSNEVLVPEFTITGTNTTILELAELPLERAKLEIKVSSDSTVGFEYTDMHSRSLVDQIKFLLESPSFTPDKYYYGQNTTTDQYIVLEDGDTLDSETGDPLIGQ